MPEIAVFHCEEKILSEITFLQLIIHCFLKQQLLSSDGVAIIVVIIIVTNQVPNG